MGVDLRAEAHKVGDVVGARLDGAAVERDLAVLRLEREAFRVDDDDDVCGVGDDSGIDATSAASMARKRATEAFMAEQEQQASAGVAGELAADVPGADMSVPVDEDMQVRARALVMGVLG